MKKKIVIDCDNTMGLPGKPIDDGQTLLYLFGREDIEIIGITTTYGNGTIDEVFRTTAYLLEKARRTDIPLLKGSLNKNGTRSEASDFLAEITATYPGEITILAIGTMTNLKNAFERDKRFFTNTKEIICMGGYLYSLPILGWNKVPELNLSSDPKSSYTLFNSGCNITIMNAQICLQAPFGLEELAPIADYDIKTYFILREYLLSCIKQTGKPIDYLWDLLPAVYISYPNLFNINYVRILSTELDLKNGIIKYEKSQNINKGKINMPEYIKDIELFYNILYESWRKIVIDY